MSWISAAERLSAIDRKAVVFDPARCLHAMDKFVDCEKCFRVCPVDAITSGKPPEFNEELCQSCLACIPVCPTGAYSAEDAVPSLMKCAVRIESKTLEVGCEAHPKMLSGPQNSEIAVRIRGCLAGLGVGGFLTIFALGKQPVIVRLDACGDCPWGGLKGQIHRQLEDVRTVLSQWGLADQLVVVEDDGALENSERPLWEADNPPLSRRDLFRLASERGQLLAARVINANSSKQAERRPSPDRLRMAAAVAQFPEHETDLKDFPGLAVLSVSEACTACGTCARVCPTKAILFTQKEDMAFRLSFRPEHCIGCDLCQQVCFPEAIEIDHTPSFRDVFDHKETITLVEGELIRCERCQALTARRPGSQLCPVCEYRRQNPFSGQLPARLLRIMQPDQGLRKENDH